MGIGSSGRIVIEVDPIEKSVIYRNLKARGLTRRTLAGYEIMAMVGKGQVSAIPANDMPAQSAFGSVRCCCLKVPIAGSTSATPERCNRAWCRTA